MKKELKLQELSAQEMRKIEGGVAPLAVAIAGGILFVGSAALGFAVGSRIWSK